MADSDSDTEIQFNMQGQEGQGDVFRDSSPVDVDRGDLHLENPLPVPQPITHYEDMHRSRSHDSHGILSPSGSPVHHGNGRLGRSMSSAGEHIRRPSPSPCGRNSPQVFRSPQRHEEPVIRPVMGRHRLQVKPEFYTGDEDWDQYISHFQNCADLGRWSEMDKALTLSACLKGQARAFYLGLSPLDRSSYYRLVQKFSERFGSVRQQSRYLTKFETRKRKPGETIASLGDELRLLAQRAYPDLGTDAQESLALHQFYKGITLEMKCRCIDRDCRTVESAVQVVERYEAILGEGNEKKKSTVRAVNNISEPGSSGPRPYPNRNNNRPRPNDKPQTPNTIELLKQVLDRIEKLESRSQSVGVKDSTRPKPYYRRGTCFICQSPEHFLQDCPIYKKCQGEMQASNGQVSGNEDPSTL